VLEQWRKKMLEE